MTNAMKTVATKLGPVVSYEAGSDIMARAFALVSPEAWGAADWKGPVSAVLHPDDLLALDVTIEQVSAAVAYYTATEATVRACPLFADPSVNAYIVKAAGYRMGPAH